MFTESKEYVVRATLTTVVTFSEMERATQITEGDAIANAQGTVSDSVWEALEQEGWAIEWVAVNEGTS